MRAASSTSTPRTSPEPPGCTQPNKCSRPSIIAGAQPRRSATASLARCNGTSAADARFASDRANEGLIEGAAGADGTDDEAAAPPCCRSASAARASRPLRLTALSASDCCGADCCGADADGATPLDGYTF